MWAYQKVVTTKLPINNVFTKTTADPFQLSQHAVMTELTRAKTLSYFACQLLEAKPALSHELEENLHRPIARAEMRAFLAGSPSPMLLVLSPRCANCASAPCFAC